MQSTQNCHTMNTRSSEKYVDNWRLKTFPFLWCGLWVLAVMVGSPQILYDTPDMLNKECSGEATTLQRKHNHTMNNIHTTQRHTTPHNTTQHHTPHNTTQHHTTQHHTPPHRTQCHTHNTTTPHYHTTLSHTTPHHTSLVRHIISP